MARRPRAPSASYSLHMDDAIALPAPAHAPARPTPGQVEAFRRDGFLVVQEFMPADELEAVRERFPRVFAHEQQRSERHDRE